MPEQLEEGWLSFALGKVFAAALPKTGVLRCPDCDARFVIVRNGLDKFDFERVPHDPADKVVGFRRPSSDCCQKKGSDSEAS